MMMMMMNVATMQLMSPGIKIENPKHRILSSNIEYCRPHIIVIVIIAITMNVINIYQYINLRISFTIVIHVCTCIFGSEFPAWLAIALVSPATVRTSECIKASRFCPRYECALLKTQGATISTCQVSHAPWMLHQFEHQQHSDGLGMTASASWRFSDETLGWPSRLCRGPNWGRPFPAPARWSQTWGTLQKKQEELVPCFKRTEKKGQNPSMDLSYRRRRRRTSNHASNQQTSIGNKRRHKHQT